MSLHPQQAQRFNLTIGTTGESSLADQAQSFVHSITGSKEPNGWEYQIEDARVGSVGYLSHFNMMRARSIVNTDFELSNVTEGNFGSFRSDISTGFMLRWGDRSCREHGSGKHRQRIHVSPWDVRRFKKSGFFIFAGIEGRYRFNDFTVEGDRPGIDENPSISDPSVYDVTLENVQATAVAGIAWYGQGFGATLSTAAKKRLITKKLPTPSTETEAYLFMLSSRC
ncbi:DUF2219 family protein [Vibrio sinaloensis]|nr:DUF2219 family protein [Vibrio sinaloensis]